MPRTDFMKQEITLAVVIFIILTTALWFFVLRDKSETVSMVLPIKFTHVIDLNTTIEIREFESSILLERLYVMNWNPYIDLYEASTAAAYRSEYILDVYPVDTLRGYRLVLPKVITTGDLPNYFLYDLKEGNFYSPEDVEWRFE